MENFEIVFDPCEAFGGAAIDYNIGEKTDLFSKFFAVWAPVMSLLRKLPWDVHIPTSGSVHDDYDTELRRLFFQQQPDFTTQNLQPKSPGQTLKTLRKQLWAVGVCNTAHQDYLLAMLTQADESFRGNAAGFSFLCGSAFKGFILTLLQQALDVNLMNLQFKTNTELQDLVQYDPEKKEAVLSYKGSVQYGKNHLLSTEAKLKIQFETKQLTWESVGMQVHSPECVQAFKKLQGIEPIDRQRYTFSPHKFLERLPENRYTYTLRGLQVAARALSRVAKPHRATQLYARMLDRLITQYFEKQHKDPEKHAQAMWRLSHRIFQRLQAQGGERHLPEYRQLAMYFHPSLMPTVKSKLPYCLGQNMLSTMQTMWVAHVDKQSSWWQFMEGIKTTCISALRRLRLGPVRHWAKRHDLTVYPNAFRETKVVHTRRGVIKAACRAFSEATSLEAIEKAYAASLRRVPKSAQPWLTAFYQWYSLPLALKQSLSKIGKSATEAQVREQVAYFKDTLAHDVIRPLHCPLPEGIQQYFVARITKQVGHAIASIESEALHTAQAKVGADSEVADKVVSALLATKSNLLRQISQSDLVELDDIPIAMTSTYNELVTTYPAAAKQIEQDQIELETAIRERGIALQQSSEPLDTPSSGAGLFATRGVGNPRPSPKKQLPGVAAAEQLKDYGARKEKVFAF